MPVIAKKMIEAGDWPTLLASVSINTGNDFVLAVQADFSSIKYSVYENGVIVGSEQTLTISSVILQGASVIPPFDEDVDPNQIWTDTELSCNFKTQINGTTFFPNRGKTYEVRVKFTQTGGAIFTEPFQLPTRP